MNTTLYPGIAFSPQAELTDNIGAADTIIPVSDAAAFPEAPNLATIGTDEEGETILYTAKTANALSGCRRGVEGTAKSWQAGEPIGRNFTAKDHADLIAEVREAAKTAEAGGVTFDDGETFQEKYESGELVGPVGKTGAPGKDGPQGPTGKTAYQYAVDGGYTGTEAQFQALLNDIPNKQPKLRGSAGQAVGFGADGAAVAVAGWSNPNLLANWYFADPVNQRGQTEYSGIGYTIDRWKWGTANGMAVIVDAGIEVKRTTSTRVILNQALTTDRETFQKMFSGRTVTISALFGQTLRHATLTIPTDDTSDWYPGGTASEKVDDMYVRLSIYGSTRNFNLSFDVYVSTGGNGGGLVTAVKCEYGTQQTLAHQDADGNWVLNDPPPDKVLELLKCQRYQVCVRAKQAYSMFGVAYGFTESIAVAFVPVPCNLRANPALATNGEFQLYNLQGSNVAISNISIDQWSTNGVRLLVEVASPVLTSGAIYQIRAKNNSDAYILFDANL